jgi:hypothetical protein
MHLHNSKQLQIVLNGLALYETTWANVNSAANVLQDGADKWQKIGAIGGKPHYNHDSDTFLKGSPAYILYARFGLNNNPDRPPITDIYLANIAKGDNPYTRFNSKHGITDRYKLYSAPSWTDKKNPTQITTTAMGAITSGPLGISYYPHGIYFNRGIFLRENYRFGNGMFLFYVTSTDEKAEPIKRLRLRYYEDMDNNHAHPRYAPSNYDKPFYENFVGVRGSNNSATARDTAEGYKPKQNLLDTLFILTVHGERYLEYSRMYE